MVIDALTPRKVKGESEEPSTSINEYEIPKELPDDVQRARLRVLEDLCAKQWG